MGCQINSFVLSNVIWINTQDVLSVVFYVFCSSTFPLQLLFIVFLNLFEFYLFLGLTMEFQVDKIEHFRHVYLFAFKVPKLPKLLKTFQLYIEPMQLETELCTRKWFSCFKKGNFELTDSPHSGRSVQFNEVWLNELICKGSVPNPDGNWTSKWYAVMIPSSLTITRWVKSKNSVHVYHTHWMKEKIFRSPPSPPVLIDWHQTTREFLSFYVNMKQRK